MNTTFAERLVSAMKGPPKVTGLALAAACGVSQPSVSDWRSGKTKSLEASNLLKAAEFLNVRAKWLSDGIGPMRPDDYDSRPSIAMENVKPLRSSSWPWPFKELTYEEWKTLKRSDQLLVEDVARSHVRPRKTGDPPSKQHAPARKRNAA